MKTLKYLATCLAIAFSSQALATYGTIIIKKEATPKSAQDFRFQISNHSPGVFYLDDDNNGTLSNTKTMTVEAGIHDVVEDATPGWQLQSIQCDAASGVTYSVNVASRKVRINVGYGKTAKCTFKNAIVPTAAHITISGKVMTSNGYAVAGAIVKVTDLANNQSYMTRTSSFGYYMIDGPQAGSFIQVSAQAKRYTFTTQTLNAVDSIENLDFVAQVPGKIRSTKSAPEEMTREEQDEMNYDARDASDG